MTDEELLEVYILYHKLDIEGLDELELEQFKEINRDSLGYAAFKLQVAVDTLKQNLMQELTKLFSRKMTNKRDC